MLAAAAQSQGITWPDVAIVAVIAIGIVAFYWIILKYTR